MSLRPCRNLHAYLFRCHLYFFLATITVAVGCRNTDIVAQVDDFTEGSPPAYCPLPGPPIRGDGSLAEGEMQCPERIAATLFEHAVCICSELTIGPSLAIDGFDSRLGPYDESSPDRLGATLAINESFQANDSVQVSADLIAAGSEGVRPGPALLVGGTLASNGALRGADSRVDVGGDVNVGGNVTLAGLTVGGTLTTPPGAIVDVTGQEQIGARANAQIDIDSPCPCSAEQILDIASIIAEQAQDNDNATIALDPAVLSDFRADSELMLPCGRFYLDRIQSPQNGLTLRIGGRTGLYIAGGITLGGSLRILLDPEASLDLFVTNFINISGDVIVGDVTSPQRLRIYVDEVGAINISGQSLLAGNLYAPQSTFSAPAGVEIFGALFVDRIAASAPVRVHYDVAVQSDSACP